MSSAARSTIWASLFCLALPMTVWGQSIPLSEADLRAVGARPIALLRTDNTAWKVCIQAVTPERLIISFLDTGQVIALPRARVKEVRLLDPAPPACPPAPPDPPPPPRPRHLGVAASLLPGLTLDLEVRRFHGFVNLGVVMAAATIGGIIPVSVGLGVQLPRWPDTPGLKFDVFGHMNFVGDTWGNSDTGFHTGN